MTEQNRAAVRDGSDVESWRLVERYVEQYPDDWRLVFQKGDAIVELNVTEEQWRAFE
jgi:hypothetical protein